MSTMENVRYRIANDRYEPQEHYVDTGYMYLEHDLQTGEVRNVTDSFQLNQTSVEYPTNNKPLAITGGSKPASVIVTQNQPGYNEVPVYNDTPDYDNIPVMRRSVNVPQKEGSVIIPRKEGSVIIRNEGMLPPREGSVIIKRSGGSVINGSVVRGPVVGERRIQRIVTAPPHRGMHLPARESVLTSPRYITTPHDRPQTVRYIRPPPPQVRQPNVRYIRDDSMVGRYPSRQVIVQNGQVELDGDQNIHRLYKTTINVPHSDTDSSSDTPREVVKTRYMSTPSNQFKNVKGVPAAKMYIPTSAVGKSKNSNGDTDNSSLDSVDIKKFQKQVIKGKKYQKRK